MSDKLELEYCKCKSCGGKMLLAYDRKREEYFALCDQCNIASNLPAVPELAQ